MKSITNSISSAIFELDGVKCRVEQHMTKCQNTDEALVNIELAMAEARAALKKLTPKPCSHCGGISQDA